MALEMGALYRDHASRVWRYARLRLPTDADAEDVTSDVFARAITSEHRFDPARGTGAAGVVGSARHAVADWWRRRREHRPDPLGPVAGDEPADWAVAGHDAFIASPAPRLSDRSASAKRLPCALAPSCRRRRSVPPWVSARPRPGCWWTGRSPSCGR